MLLACGMMNVLGGVNGLGMVILDDSLDVLLYDVWYFDFVGNFIRDEYFYFFNHGNFNDLNFRNLLNMVFVLGVVRERSFHVTEKKSW